MGAEGGGGGGGELGTSVFLFFFFSFMRFFVEGFLEGEGGLVFRFFFEKKQKKGEKRRKRGRAHQRYQSSIHLSLSLS